MRRSSSGVWFPVCEFEFCPAFDKNPLKMFEFCPAFDKKFALDESQYLVYGNDGISWGSCLEGVSQNVLLHGTTVWAWAGLKHLWHCGTRSALAEPVSGDYGSSAGIEQETFEYIYEWWRGNSYTFHYSATVQP